jgi:hypothetical protein
MADNLDIRIESGNNQAAQPSTRLPDPLVVEVKRNGTAAAQVQVRFLVTEGQGKIGLATDHLDSTITMQTGANGQASLPVWVLGPTGAQRVAARAGSPPLHNVVFDAFFSRTLTILNERPLEAHANAQVADALVVQVTSGTGPVSGTLVTFQVAAGGGKIAADTPATFGTRAEVRTDADGYAVVNCWQLGVGGAQQVTARIDGPPPVSVTFNATVIPG